MKIWLIKLRTSGEWYCMYVSLPLPTLYRWVLPLSPLMQWTPASSGVHELTHYPNYSGWRLLRLFLTNHCFVDRIDDKSHCEDDQSVSSWANRAEWRTTNLFFSAHEKTNYLDNGRVKRPRKRPSDVTPCLEKYNRKNTISRVSVAGKLTWLWNTSKILNYFNFF